MLFRKLLMLCECDLKAEGSLGSYVTAAVWMGGVLCVSRLYMDTVWRHSRNPIKCSCTDPATGLPPLPGCQA